MNKSDDIKEISIALCNAQSEIENATKSSSNPYFKSKYADLTEVINTVKPVLNKYCISVLQLPSYEDGIVRVETTLVHVSGQWISSITGAPIAKADAQSVGSAITYCRRYGLAALMCIGQEDDDGHSASQPPKNKDYVEVRNYLGATRIIHLVAQKNVPQETVDAWLEKAKVQSLDELNPNQIKAIIDMLEKK